MPKFIVEMHIAYVTEFEAESYASASEQAMDIADNLPLIEFNNVGMVRASLIAKEDIGTSPVVFYSQED